MVPVMGRKEIYKDYPERQLTEEIIGAAIEVHKFLGPGLLESAYQTCMIQELTIRGLHFEAEKPLPLQYKGVELATSYRLDLVVEKKVVVELKSVKRLDVLCASVVSFYLSHPHNKNHP